MARSARKHYVSFIIFSVFVIAFSTFLIVTAYYYVTGKENVDIKSFAPGVPAFFLFFLARKEWRSARAARNMEKRKKVPATDVIDPMDEVIATAKAEKAEAEKKRTEQQSDPIT
jgi:hypothetical protein